MHQRTKSFLIAAAFAALLAIVPALNRLSGPKAAAPVRRGDFRHGFWLEEVSQAAGVGVTHRGPTLDPVLAPIMPQIASMGAAVAVADFDKDGWPDFYATDSAEGSANHLFHNLHNGKFEDVAAKLGVADVNGAGTGVSMGAVWGDYDNDGFDDLLVFKWGRPRLFHNDGGHGFTDVTEKASLPPWVNANAATWLDYDADGKLDLLICGYYPESVNLWKLTTTRIMPTSFEMAQNGGRKFLLRGRGDGTFEDVTATVGLNSHRWTLAVGAADLRGTGFPDIVMANDYGVTEVWANQGGRKFEEIGAPSGIGRTAKSGMNVAFGDITNQGQFAVYVSNISAEGNIVQGNNLWVPHAGTHGDALQYDNWGEGSGVFLGGWSFGAQFGDLNNDGANDLVLTNGYVSAGEKSYWYDFGKITGANKAIIVDAKNWPPMQGMSLSGYEQKHVWVNDGYGKFTDVAQEVGYDDTHDGRSVALADFWNEGVQDFAVANQRGPLRLYKNHVAPGSHWVGLALAGTKSNRSAIGASVMLYWKDAQGQPMRQLQQVACASGFCAQNDRRLHFGLGKSPQIEKAVIRWPLAGSPPQTVPAAALRLGAVNLVKEPS